MGGGARTEGAANVPGPPACVSWPVSRRQTALERRAAMRRRERRAGPPTNVRRSRRIIMGILGYYPRFTVEKKDVIPGTSGDSRPKRSTVPSAGTDPARRKAGAGSGKRKGPRGGRRESPSPLEGLGPGRPTGSPSGRSAYRRADLTAAAGVVSLTRPSDL